MKVATIFGTRPEIIRLSSVIEKLDGLCEQTLVHTGQNYDPNLSDIFFEELGVRQPDECWGIKTGRFSDQIAEMIRRAGEYFTKEKPDRVLILGDTNSGLAAMVAARMQIPVFHMEAGNRCYDDRVPEEINRRVIDHCSKILMPYTHRSKENLIREGIDRTKIYVTGNPIWEVILANKPKIAASDVLARMNLTEKQYMVVSIHRSENVDDVDIGCVDNTVSDSTDNSASKHVTSKGKYEFDEGGSDSFLITDARNFPHARQHAVIIEQGVGQALFVPSGWYHQVENIMPNPITMLASSSSPSSSSTAPDTDTDEVVRKIDTSST